MSLIECFARGGGGRRGVDREKGKWKRRRSGWIYGRGYLRGVCVSFILPDSQVNVIYAAVAHRRVVQASPDHEASWFYNL